MKVKDLKPTGYVNQGIHMHLNDGELSYFTDIHALDRDRDGHTVFVGLSYEESLRFKQYHDSYLESDAWANPDDYAQLMIRHERSRLLSSDFLH